jgi:hypothetical protein
MSFNVRVFGYSGVAQLAQVAPHNYSANGPWALQEPYNWAQIFPTAGMTAVSSTVVPNDTSQVIAIEVPDGQTIRYEINPPQRVGGIVAANTNSPRMSGLMILPWGVNWTISVVEQSFFP